LRAAGLPDAYDRLKELTRGKPLTSSDYKSWIDTLSVDEPTKKQLEALSPFTFTGLAEQLVERALA
jgi:adenylosuccinate lyase